MAALFCTTLTLWIATVATARPPSPLGSLGPADFRPIVVDASPSPAPTTAVIGFAATERLAPITDFRPPAHTLAPRPTPEQPTAARVVPKAPALRVAPRPTPVTRSRLTGSGATGTATWYCKTGVSACHRSYPGGMYAAAGPALRVGAWRGRTVQVCGGGRCIDVKLIDWCACGGSHIIDLYSDAFRQLAPLSAGALRVTVRW